MKKAQAGDLFITNCKLVYIVISRFMDKDADTIKVCHIATLPGGEQKLQCTLWLAWECDRDELLYSSEYEA